MKNIFLIFLFCSYSVLLAQNNDTILEDKVKINNTIALGYTEEQVNAILGKPLEIKYYYSEIDDETWKEYNFNGNIFYFYNNKLIEFELKNDLLFFNNSAIRVGSNINLISNIFTNSYNQKGVTGSIGFIIINILLSDGNISNQYVLIQYSPLSSKIISIRTASY